MKKFIVGLLCGVMIAINVTVFAADSITIPAHTDLFYVNDFVGVLTNETIEHIVSVNDLLYVKCGGQIVVTIIDFTNGTNINDYSIDMFNTWGIGSADRNNGLLLLLSIGDDDYIVQTGSGLNVSVNDIRSVLDDFLEPYFAIGEYDKGVVSAFDQFVAMYEILYDISLSLDNSLKLVINGVDITGEMEVKPQIINGRVVVPIKNIAEAFGATASYDEKLIP